MGKGARIALVSVAVLALAGAGGAWFALREYARPGDLAEPRALVVPRGGLAHTGAALAEAGLVRSALEFRTAALLTMRRGPLHAAEFEFPAHASLRDVLAVLRTAKPVQHKLTIPEGLSAAQVALLLAGADALEGEVVVPQEGMMLPETYLFEHGTTRAALVERGQQMMQHALDQAWAQRRPDLPLSSEREALILASIVERETARPDERPHIAAVYLNRLRIGMKLQSDPTVAYGASGGLGTLDHGITRAELDRDDPYNTYRIDGLPPGPICMPGAASLKAVTQPADSDDLFFVADGSGGHVFARTADEHLRHVVQWRAIERGRESDRARKAVR